jgi:hypothetical protein
LYQNDQELPKSIDQYEFQPKAESGLTTAGIYRPAVPNSELLEKVLTTVEIFSFF